MFTDKLHTRRAGFTLLEVLVTVAIISILLATVIASFGPAREQSRDAQRQTDLRTVEAALALYKNKYDRYPEACNGPTTGAAPNWSGQAGSGYECASGNQFIVGLATEFMPALPTDPKLNPDSTISNSGYVYAVNNEGSVYKFMALNTVETEIVDDEHQYFRCGDDYVLNRMIGGFSFEDPGICRRTPNNSNGNASAGTRTLNECNTPRLYQTTYAISDGFSTDSRGNRLSPERGQEYDTEIVRCG